MVNLHWRLLAVVLAGIILAGCESSAPEEPTEPPPAPVVDPGDADQDRTPPRDEWRVNSEGVPYSPTDPNSPLGTVFYFAFDESIIARSDTRTLNAHAEYLKTHRDATIQLAGHCDSRGTREYNLALGERRADSVRDYLVAQGVSRRQIDTESFGEERPAGQPSGPGDETAHARNRRVRMTYGRR